MTTNAMKYLQFLIFISSLVFTTSQNDFFTECGWTDGVEVLEINIETPYIQKLERYVFSEKHSYIVLWTVYDDSESAKNLSYVQNKKEKKKRGNTSTSQEGGQKRNFKYHMYYIPANTPEAVGLKVTVDYVTNFYDYLRNISHFPVTITREEHRIGSKELRFLLFNEPIQTNYVSNQWSRGELVTFEENLLSRLYKVTLFRNIEEVPPMPRYINPFDAFVGYYDTKLIALKTQTSKLQEYTKNFVNFIRRCSSENLEFYERQYDLSLFHQTNSLRYNGRLDADEQYVLYEYNDKCKINKTTATVKGSVRLNSQNINIKKYHYILQNIKLQELHIFIRPLIEIKTLNCLLQQEYWFSNFRKLYHKITIFQNHQLNISFLVAFQDLISDLLNNDVTKNVYKFIRVCKNPNTEFPGSSSSVPY